MAYSDDAVRAKLSALNETQESIVTVAQWVMFHRRHADRTGTIWLQKLKEAGASKRLNLIYLANEVAQQSKARKKDDFLIAFSPIIAEATSIAYKGATIEVQQKLRRVIEVWRQRQIFETPIQEAVETRVNELDKSRSSNKKPLLGGSIFSSASGPSAPRELQPLVALQIAVTKALASSSSATSTADIEYDKLNDPSKTIPTLPLLAARLNALMKSLANAEGAVSQGIKARRALLDDLEKLLETNKVALAVEEIKHAELVDRKLAMEAKKREVEDSIVRGLSSDPSGTTTHGVDPGAGLNGGSDSHPRNGTTLELEPPPREDLTPPPVESLTPVASPHATDPSSTITQKPQDQIIPDHTTIASATQIQPPSQQPPPPFPVHPIPGADLLSSLSVPPARHYPTDTTTSSFSLGTATAGVGGVSGNGGGGGGGVGWSGGVGSAGTSGFKKRKLEADFAGFGSGEDVMADLDADVAELLRAESGGGS